MPATGSCLCGAVTYEIDQALSDVIVCHCTDCQKSSGSAASHNIVIATENLKITGASPQAFSQVVDSGRTLTRTFCGACGSQLFSQRDTNPETMVVKSGTLDDRHGFKVVMDIWTASANPWLPRDVSVPQHEGNRPPPK